MKKLIIFDLDGTLIDTLEDLKNAVNYALNFKNWPLKTKEQIRMAIGNGVAKLVERCLPNGATHEEYIEALSIFTKYYEKYYNVNTKPYIGVKELLLKLKNEGYLLAVCTNKIDDVAHELVETFYPNIFDFIQGDVPGLKKKPAPDMINKIMNHFNLTSKEAIYIGDTDVDMNTGINSHLDYIIESYGYRTKEELKTLCPHSIVVNNTDELYEQIKKLG